MKIRIYEKQIALYKQQRVIEYQLVAPNDFQVNILNYGGIIRAIYTHDKYRKLDNIIVTNQHFDPANPGHAGAITGPHAGRIANGEFTLNDIAYHLEQNNNLHNLHSGTNSLDKQIWSITKLERGISLSYTTYDGQFGLPGIVSYTVNYEITNLNQLSISYSATTNCDTIINLTNHSYFDLSCGKNPMDQELFIDAEYFGAIDETGLFGGQLIKVQDTPFDFRTKKAISRDINQLHPQLAYGRGYDHPFLIGSEPTQLTDPISGRLLRIFTSQPACVVYSTNFFKPWRGAVCLETQKLPNAINLPAYKNQVIIKSSEKYTDTTIWQFGVI